MDRNWKYAIAAVVTAASLLVARSVAQDRVAAIPETEVLLQNECVRVQYHDVEVGQTTPMHSHPKYVVYVLNPYKARISLADGSQRISEHPAGAAFWNEATVHAVENIGETRIHNLVVEMKPGASCH